MKTARSQDYLTALAMPHTDHAEQSESRHICLDQFLKLHGLVETGGEAKILIQGGKVRLNGAVETRRRKKLVAGDVIELRGKTQIVS